MFRVARSIRARLTLWYATVLGALLVVFSVGVYGFVDHRLTVQLNQRLNDNFNAIARSLGENPEVEELAELDQAGLTEAFEVRRDGALLYESQFWKKAVARQNNFRIRRGVVEEHGGKFDLAVVVSTASTRHLLRTLAIIFAGAIPAGVLLTLVGGSWLAARTLAPLTALAQRAREITAENLSRRLPVVNPDDELGRLAAEFNAVLARLERTFEHMRRFAADASHELRTPLTALRAVGEAALQSEPGTAGYREAIGGMLEETHRLVSVLDKLLVLTRADADRAVVTKGECDLAAVARDVVELVAVLAEEKEQRLEVDAHEPAPVWADDRLVREAILNVLDNAIKYTPSGGTVRLRVSSDAERCVVEVRDNGPGIALEHQERIFERFFRVEHSACIPGSGLGLAIAKWAIVANGGRIEVESGIGHGSTFRIELPRQRK